ncbi:hypothetical protein MSMEI_6248 [Mycolicibacterium smegmatis MC2 155]|uniref:Uncharacterized protein n=4 Tax=Mycolicibacterium smegmatis TaxID=1772 RepID=I7GGE9_MYCS2|nr:hypothetical protein MSMEI_6248 [Mycolicibacterium smegmatis MC2 155]
MGMSASDTKTPARQPRFVGPQCYERDMTIQCRDCVAGLEHCHGTLIHHVRYCVECTDDGCTTPEIAHTFSIDCETVGCLCSEDIAIAI